MNAQLASLPRVPPGRSAIWSGVLLLVLIETLVVSMLVMSYYYLRSGTLLWPPPGVDPSGLIKPAVSHGLVVLGALLAWFAADGPAHRRSTSAGRVRWLLPLALVLLAIALVLKVNDLKSLEFSWRSHAYGSLVWTLDGYQIFHLATLTLAGLVIWGFSLVQMRRDRSLNDPHRINTARVRAALESLVLYWAFVAAAAVVLYVVVQISPRIL